MFDEGSQEEENRLHAENPCVGDFWNEMWNPVSVVVDVTPFTVVVCETTKRVQAEKWTWDTSKLTTYSREAFRYRYTFGRIGNHEYVGESERPRDNAHWCHVHPRAHAWARDAALEDVDVKAETEIE